LSQGRYYLGAKDRRFALKEQEDRRKLILTIIGTEKVHNQDELKEKLKISGVEVTQATISRDLKALGVIRVYDPAYGYVYTKNIPRTQEPDPGIWEDLISGIKDIKFSGNLVVIKTKLGHATGVAFEIDQLNLPEVVGTVGGDDTLLVVLREGVNREDFLNDLRKGF